MELFLRLLLAHLFGDFLFQPGKWVKEKEQKKLKSPKLYLHTLLHIILALIFMWDMKMLPAAIFIGVTHFIIDAGKLLFQNKKNRRTLFFIDQLLHLIVIVGVALFYSEEPLVIKLSTEQLLLLACLVFLTFPASITIKTIISVYTPFTEMDEDDSLENAGKYIGILERLLVFIFIATAHWEGVGFLIAAKSIFRFSDLTQSKDRKLTEYIMIGTLLSFGLAILVGIVFLELS